MWCGFISGTHQPKLFSITIAVEVSVDSGEAKNLAFFQLHTFWFSLLFVYPPCRQAGRSRGPIRFSNLFTK